VTPPPVLNTQQQPSSPPSIGSLSGVIGDNRLVGSDGFETAMLVAGHPQTVVAGGRNWPYHSIH
jgi:hypothetical protein